MFISLFGYSFGAPEQDFELTDVALSLGEVRTGDISWPLRHGTRPGVDYLDAGSITFTGVTTFGINDEVAADDVVGQFLRAWYGGLDMGPGEEVSLEVTTHSKKRVVFGRPRKIDPPVPGSALMEAGIAEVTALFRVTDPLIYGSESAKVSLSVVPKSLGGIIAPLTTPISTTMTSGVEYRHIEVEGDAPAPTKVTFHGPATDPRVTVGGATVGIKGQILYDEEIIVDGRNRTVTYADGRQASMKLAKESRMDKLSVRPGTHEISFTATDRTGTARTTVEATPAYYHI